jgi:hypothetical protein
MPVGGRCVTIRVEHINTLSSMLQILPVPYDTLILRFHINWDWLSVDKTVSEPLYMCLSVFVK